MNEKLIDKYIHTLSEKLGVAAKQVYEALYHQQIVSGIMEIAFGLLFLILLIVSVKFVINIYTKAEFVKDESGYYPRNKPVNIYAKIQDSDFVGEGIIWVVIAFLWIILVIVICVLLPNGIMKLLNPDYYALKEIMDVFGK